MYKLTQDFKNSLILDSKDIVIDYAELGVDSILKDGVLKDIPIVGSIATVFKFGKNIYDRNLLKQTLTFIEELNNGTVSEDKLIAYKSTIENNPKKCEEELERILLYLNNFMDKEKSIRLSKIFKAYIRTEITWDEFCEYSEIINRLFTQDISMLIGLERDTMCKADYYKIERLNSLGMIKVFSRNDFEKKIMIEANNYTGYKFLKLNDYGRKFVEIIK